jgi:MYXO-CTERM domain-containing protein
MKTKKLDSARFPSFVRWCRLAGATLVVLFAAWPVEASPIWIAQNALQAEAIKTWTPFLAGGPTLWASEPAPPVPAGLVLPMQNGLLVETPFVDYLVWRRDLDPTRFDLYHQTLGPELAQLPPTTTTTTPPAAQGVTPPPLPSPSPVPEPSSAALALAMIGAAGWWRSRRRTRPSDALANA